VTIRIAIAGMQTESSTFSLDRTDVSRFEQLRGQALLSVYDWSERLEQLVADVEWVPLLRAVAFPGGPVEPEAFDGFEAGGRPSCWGTARRCVP
jgi:microcystin degradation protein MlrC